MAKNQISEHYMANLLNKWYLHMRSHEVEQAENVKKEIDEKLPNMEENQDLLLYYSLLDFRHKIMTKNFAEDDILLGKVEPFKENMNHILTYYFYFFQGMYYWKTGKYNDALTQYQLAEKELGHVPDEFEKAEFHYRVGFVYYDIRKNILSIDHVRKAQNIFGQDEAYIRKYADCENLLGINCIALKHYEEAEEHLLTALDYAVKSNDQELVLHVKYNLGYLYSEQNLSEVAINRLVEVKEYNFNSCKTNFLLAREYFKTNQNEQALFLLEEGIKSCHNLKNTEYLHHLSILKAFYSPELETSQVESVVQEANVYFKKEGLWYFIQEYAERLAKRFYEEQNYEKSSYYFNLSYETKETIFELEALK
ncbi:hypothetical protein [Fictibacillus gelatini]|uniref:response regulator aspartate phosphatase n=1 Tax=Fictibacillus gelatini TaxID=225985 RepID=UPI0005567852|nr:hypothetical protein [Fictibacillus gelatini]